MAETGMKQDFIVIGAGIIGLATAERLLQHGATVTILERGAAGQESSWAGGGILSLLCPWDYPDEVTRLALYSANLFAAWAADLHQASGIDPEYDSSGLVICAPFNALVAQQWCAAHQVALLQGKADGYALPTTDEVLYLPQAAQVRNPRLMRALRKRVELLGGIIIEQSAAQHIRADHDRVVKVEASSGKYSADKYIVTAGAWSQEVLGPHALQLEIKPVRGQMLLFKFAAPPLQHIVVQRDLYLIPRRDGHLLVGSTLEDAGFDKKTTRAAHDDLFKRAQNILPQLCGMPVMQQWAGLRPGSPGNIPTIARHPRLKNLYLNSGHFRYGVTMAPGSAEVLHNVLTGGMQPFDVAPYNAGWGA